MEWRASTEVEHEHCPHVAAQSIICCKCGKKVSPWPCQHEPDYDRPGKLIKREVDSRPTVLMPCKKCGEYY